MTCTPHSPQERRRLQKVAREYRQRGYEVTVNPAATDLPAALADCSLDLIAERNGKTIAVEVRSRDTLALNGENDLRRISKLIHQLPNWELELVVTNPRHPLRAS
jgi:Holliday junction resolvase